MERPGLVRQISNNKLVIPPQVKIALGWDNGTKIEYIIDEGRLILQAYSKSCVFCGRKTEDVFFGKPLCHLCRKEIVKVSLFIQPKSQKQN